ncbi:nucleotidyltransferase domain-containing protein [Candidatus Woesearchaeota archaeon]|nr:nucleotidyltransferase domain-containing protein [Candidatus Woesearchaeota archaeon]
MEININILKPFFEDPQKGFLIRELARYLKTNHTKVRIHLKKLQKEGFLDLNKEGLYPCYKFKISKKTLNLKLYFNLEKLRESEIVEDLEKKYDFPTIILFGSYSQGMDTKDSDIDICVVTKIKKDFNSEKYEKIIKRNVNLIFYDNLKNAKNKELVNNICNGIVLSGELEVV